MKTILLKQHALFVLFLFFTTLGAWAQTTVTVTDLDTATPTNTYSPMPAGVTFSSAVKGSGLTNTQFTGAMASSGFNTASPEASFTAKKYYSFTITTDATHKATLKNFLWKTWMSATVAGVAKLTIKYSFDGGATIANFGTPSQAIPATGYNTLTFTGSPDLTIPASTTVTLYLIPSNATGTNGQFWSIYYVDGSTFDIKVESAAEAPTVTTTTISNVATLTATSGGTVSSTGGAALTAKGIVWSSATTTPTVALSTKTVNTDGTDVSTFISDLTGLASNTKYYYAAYATNSVGTSYGAINSFYTLALVPAVPTVDGATASTLNVTVNTGGNNTDTLYAIQEAGGLYVQADGTLGATAVWKTAADWNAVKTVKGLTADTDYFFAVKAQNGAATPVETAFSGTATGHTLPAASISLDNSSLTFSNVCINTTAKGSFTFSGKNIVGTGSVVVSAINGYSFSLSETGTFSPTLTIDNYTGASTTVWVQFAPTAVQTYDGSITVNAQGSNASAQFTAAVTAKGVNTGGSIATGSATGVTSIAATLQGTATAGGCTLFSVYGIEYSTVDGFDNGTGTPVVAGNLTGNNFSIALSNLNPDTTYYFKAYGTDGSGTYYGLQQSFKTALALKAPVTTPATLADQVSFTANWTAVEGATEYKLDVSTSPDFTTGSFATGYENLSVTGTSQIVTGLPGYTTYYYRVRAYNVNSTSPNSNITTVTTKASQVTWKITDGETVAKWTPSVYPDNSPVILNTTVAAIIDANYSTATNGSFTAKSVTINSGKTLTVNTGTTLTIWDNIINNANADNFLVENNGALLQSSDAVANTNTGNIVVKKDSNPLYRLDYTLWSSPVTGTQSLLNFSPLTNSENFYEYKYDTPAGSTTPVEQYFGIAPASTFTAAKGYLVRMPDTDTAAGYNAGTASIVYHGNFTGVPNNGNVSIPASTTGNKYTAVGNPYSSPISLADFYTENANALESGSAVYFWRKKNDAAVSSYAYLTLAGLVVNGASGTSGNEGGQNQSGFYSGNNANYLISQGQGFIIKTKANPTATNIVFKNGMRRAAPGADQGFFKPADATMSRYWLNVTGTTTGFSQAAVAYMDGGTLGLDYGYDGKKFTDGGSVALYSIAADTNLAIQARPKFEASDVVPMGFEAIAPGQYTIALDHFDGLFDGEQDIYIKDNLEGLTHNLKNGAYTFTSKEGTFTERFEIVYTNVLSTNNPALNANSVIVYKQGTTININSTTAEVTGVTIYDIRGRKLYTQSNINATQTAITGLQAQQEVLIVEINTAKGKVSKKLVF